MSWWTSFKRNPEKMKVGRNDPFPYVAVEKNIKNAVWSNENYERK